MSGQRQIDITWMNRSDLPRVLEIERASFQYPWSKEAFVQSFKSYAIIGMVARSSVLDRNRREVFGFVIYELFSNRIEILNMAVAPECRREGIGRTIIDRMKSKISSRRTSLVATVRETNLHAQLFLRSQGFLATSVLKGYYEEPPNEDAYEMLWQARKLQETNG